MTAPTGYRKVAGLNIPLPLVPRIIVAIQNRYPEATAGIADPEAAVRAALRAWVIETLAEYEAAKAKAPVNIAVAQTITSYEAKAEAAKEKAIADAAGITDDLPPADPEVP